MKKQLLLLLATIVSINSYAQIIFEKGYYINNADQKVECLIKNIDWESNPTKFEYKLTEQSDKIEVTIKTVKEFGVYNTSKYIRRTVKIDRSSEDVKNLSKYSNPVFKKEELFLKVLVEGEASLYGYSEGNLRRYFYSIGNAAIEQLVFKSFKTPERIIGVNNGFRRQLSNDLKCSTITAKKTRNLDYYKKELVRFFIAYNECSNNEFINFEAKQKRDLFNLNIRPGLKYSSLSINNELTNDRDTDFGNKMGFRFGVEAEFIMPFHKSKWGILIEPTYQSFKSEKESASNNIFGTIHKANADYKSIELPIGIRHYFFLNEHSAFFINASYIFDFSFKSTIDFDFSVYDLKIETRNNLAFGLGYKHNGKYSLELRYQTNRAVLGNYILWDSDYKTLAVIFGYSIF